CARYWGDIAGTFNFDSW
nr:immunoglobulin heavy chain junction region [Macaca mulatta]